MHQCYVNVPIILLRAPLSVVMSSGCADTVFLLTARRVFTTDVIDELRSLEGRGGKESKQRGRFLGDRRRVGEGNTKVEVDK